MSFEVITDASKQDVVTELAATCLEHELVGNILWGLQDWGFDHVIVCFSLAETENGWGYNEIPECSEPFYYTCPLRFLNLAPTTSATWRARVRAFHMQQPETLQ